MTDNRIIRWLALAVIRQALSDCRNVHYRRCALAWLMSPDAEVWIDAAGLDRDCLLQRLRQVV